WQGCFLFCQSPSFFSYTNHFSLNAAGVMSKWAEMRFTSAVVKVGVIFLQQLPQVRQSVSAHTSLSTVSIILCKPFGGLFSSFVKSVRNFLLLRFTFCLNERIFTFIFPPKISKTKIGNNERMHQ